MNEKTFLYLSITTIALITEAIWLFALVAILKLCDIAFGVYVVKKLKEKFIRGRFFEGFLTLIPYAVIIGVSMLVSEKIFNGSLFEIDHLLPKIATILLMIMECQSIDRKRQKLGRKPFIEWLRSVIKTFKELYKNVNSIFKPTTEEEL